MIRKTIYSFYLFFLFLIGNNYSQVYHHGGDFVIRGDIRIEGDLKSYSSFSVDDLVEIKLNGNLIHENDTSTFIKVNLIGGFTPKGTINFTGPQRQYIYTTSSTNLNIIKNSNPIGLTFKKADSTSGNTNFANPLIWEYVDLSPATSNILLDSTNIELKHEYGSSQTNRTNKYGSIKGESNTSLVLSDSLEKISGIIPGNSNFSTHNFNLGFVINHSNTYPEAVEYSRYGTYMPDVSDTSFNRYFVVNKPVNFNSPTIVYHDNLLRSMNQDSLDIFVSINNGDSWKQVGATTNTGLKTITDNNNSEWMPIGINDKSIITIAERDCKNPPIVNLTKDSIAICSGNNAEIKFDSITIGCAIKWFKDGVFYSNSNYPTAESAELTVSQPGWYLITILDSKGCTNKDSIKVKSSDLPEFDSSIANAFNITVPCIGDPVIFTANPEPTDSSNMTYSWDFDYYTNNGLNTSTLKNPSFLYTQSGPHSVKLIITDSSGCSNSNIRNADVLPYPIADFSFQNACDNTPINFTNLSTSSYPGLAYSWDFGSNTSSIENPTHTFPSQGSFQVELIANLLNTCSDTLVKTINIFPLPVANFTFNDTCENDTVFYVNQSTVLVTDSIITTEWNFSNVALSNLYNSYYVYSSDNTYSTELKVTTSNGCSHDTIKTVDIYPSPVVDFLSRNDLNPFASSFCLYDTIQFSPVPDSLVSVWDFGDNSSSNDTTALKKFDNFGTFNVVLSQTSSNGCSSKKNKSIQINPTPVALTNSPEDQCYGLPVSFSSLSSIDNNNTITEHRWNFEYPLASTPTLAQNPFPVVFSDTGIKIIELTVTSNNNCINSILDTVQVFPVPNINLGQDSISTCGTSYLLTAPQGCVNFWSNGLTSDSLLVNYSNTYHLKSTDNNGCISRDTVDITLNSSFLPEIASSSSCDSSILDAGSPNATYYWFDSTASYTYSYSNGQINLTGISDTIANTRLLNINSSGLYKVLVVDQNNCPGEDSINIVISASPINYSTFSDTLNPCVGDSMLTDSLPVGINYAYTWNPQISSNSSRIWVSQSNTYTVVVKDTLTGCSLTNVISVIPKSNPQLDLRLINHFTNDSINICDSVTIISDPLSNSYLWTDANQNPIGFNSSININSSGYYNCEISFGTCSNSDSIHVSAFQTPVFELLGGISDTTLCSYNSLVTNDLSVFGSTFNWSSGSTDSILNIVSAGNYIVEVGDSLSPGLCKSKDTVLVSFNPVLDVNLGPDLLKCNGSDLQLSTGLLNNNIQHQWLKDGLVLNNNNISSLLVSDTGTYNVIITDSIGCSAKDTIKINASNQELFAQFLSSSIVSQGDSVKFINLSYPAPYTSSWIINESIYDIESPIHSTWINSNNDSVSNDTVTAQLTVRNPSCVALLKKNIIIRPNKKNKKILNQNIAVYTEIDVTLYPNPNNGNFILDFQINNDYLVESYLGIYNLAGKCISQEKIYIQDGLQKQISLENIPRGVYLVTVYSSASVKTIKFIKT